MTEAIEVTDSTHRALQEIAESMPGNPTPADVVVMLLARHGTDMTPDDTAVDVSIDGTAFIAGE